MWFIHSKWIKHCFLFWLIAIHHPKSKWKWCFSLHSFFILVMQSRNNYPPSVRVSWIIPKGGFLVTRFQPLTKSYFWFNYSDLTRQQTPNGGLVMEIFSFEGNLGWYGPLFGLIFWMLNFQIIGIIRGSNWKSKPPGPKPTLTHVCWFHPPKSCVNFSRFFSGKTYFHARGWSSTQ